MSPAPAPARGARAPFSPRGLAPGVLLCAAVAAVAFGLQAVEIDLFGRAWLEGLVLAILLGTAIRMVWTPSALWTPGVRFSARTLLEIAVALLGAGISGATVMALGPGLLVGVVAVVVLALVAGYAIGRAFGLPSRMALLVACGNAICGNSAIAAVAPVIEAEGEDVAAAIGFTAVLGIGVVLLVPVVGALLGYDPMRVGVLAGLTVYAVPQVLAAAAPAGTLAIQTGAVVKLVRVLMLGPVCLVLALFGPAARSRASGGERKRPALHHMAPWFIVVFLVLMGLRSAGLIPEALIAPLNTVVMALTLIAMAALGLGVDPRAFVRAGPRVAAVACLSALVIALLALGVIALVIPA